MKLLLAVLALALAGCAGVEVKTTDPATGATTTTIDLTQGKLAVATHADLQAAAAYATAHGYPERAAVRMAQDTVLTAVEKQASACANAIQAALDQIKPLGAPAAGPITTLEMTEEAVGNFQGIPARVKILCAPAPLPPLPPLPGIPKLPIP